MLSRLAADACKGLVAGAAGTAAMTLSSTLEAKLRNRGGSATPATAASRLLGVKPVNEEAETRFANLVHWGYGTGMGAVRGVLSTFGLGPVPATLAHLGLVLGSEQVALPATGAAPPATDWAPKQVATDLVHHSVYVVVASVAFWLVDRQPWKLR